MTLLVRRSQASDTDETLTVLAREGDDDAFAELYRRHLQAAKSTARSMTRSRDDVDDVVAEAFTGVLNALRNGRGPTDNFRAYLLACVRNGCYVRRKTALVIDSEEMEAASPPALEDPEKYVEADTVARAFASLSPRWQRTLWLTEVEQRPAAEVGERMQLAPNATAALSRRARQAFAAAYLSQHVAQLVGIGCAPIAPRLGAYVRDTLRPNERAEVAEHLAVCASCSRAVDELNDLNTSLRSLQTPVAAAGAGAAAVGTGIALSATAGVGGTWAALLGAGALVKVAAVALVVVPTVAFGISRATESTPSHQNLTPATVVAPPNGTVPGGGALVTVTSSVATPNASTSGLPSGATSGAGADVPVTGAGQAAAGAPSTVAEDPTGSTTGGGVAVPTVTGLGGATLPPITVPGKGLPGASLPVISVPAISVPAISVPPLLLPVISLPAVSVPPVSLPPVQLPVVSVPPVQLPVVGTVHLPVISVPPITVPPITVPPITVPPISVPGVTLPVIPVPTVTLPVIGLPALTVPTLPPVTLPAFTIPRLGLGG